MSVPEPTRTGTGPFRCAVTWYRVTCDLDARTPLVVLHGGPGATHVYTLRVARLAEQGSGGRAPRQLG